MSGFLAIDWGTTNRRVFLVEGGIATRAERTDRGAAMVSDFAAEVAGIRAEFGDLPVLLAGMVGSDRGWRAVPYVSAPAGLDEVAAGLDWIDARTAIVPGLAYRGGPRRGDVMRGEEVQLLGAIEGKLVPANAMLCQPGTHCKWAWSTDGRVTKFATVMTGELYALLRNHSLLASQLTGSAMDTEAFREGVLEGAQGDLAASLFGIRAARLLKLRRPGDDSAFASGLLIGADIAPRLKEVGRETVHILADPELGGLYAAGISALGGYSRHVNSEAAFVAGAVGIWERIQ